VATNCVVAFSGRPLPFYACIQPNRRASAKRYRAGRAPTIGATPHLSIIAKHLSIRRALIRRWRRSAAPQQRYSGDMACAGGEYICHRALRGAKLVWRATNACHYERYHLCVTFFLCLHGGAPASAIHSACDDGV